MTTSVGLLMYRRRPFEVLIAHPGGPFWAAKDAGAWSIPKGLPEAGERPLETARREFTEETGSSPPDSGYLHLGSVTQRSGKTVEAFAVLGSLDPGTIRSNLVSIEWPPRSGRTIDIPEIDQVSWESVDGARRRLNPAQAPLLDRLESLLSEGIAEPVSLDDTLPVRQALLRSHQTLDEILQPGDDEAAHFGIWSGDELVAIGSVFDDPSDETGAPLRIRFMATHPDRQGRGLGRKVLQRCLDHAGRRSGAVWCTARVPASGFYTSQGFEVVGDVFDIDGIGPHVLMVRSPGPEDVRAIAGEWIERAT